MMNHEVLIIEDDATLLRGLRDNFESRGYRVTTATDGEAGLDAAIASRPDLILLDIMLPKMNGYQVCRALRDADVWTPVLMLTAKDGELDEAEALDLGADDYITKPFAFVVLLARIRALLRRGSAERPTELVAGNLSLDPAAHEVRRGDQLVDLTGREFSILEFLLRRVGEVASKAEIMEHVWDFAFDGDPNIVEVYVRSLRKKIDVPFERQAIETVRGAGYRLDRNGG
jgi:two-component system OmpR family response regulator